MRRLANAALVLWLAYTISFFLLYVLPGDAALARIGGEGGGADQISPEQIEQLREKLGLSGSLIVQYFRRLGGVLTGDFGLSLRNDQPVTEVIGAAVPATLQLASAALLVALILGCGFAIAGNVSRRPWLQTLATSVPAIGLGIPAFWVGILMISLFSFTLKMLPANGNAGFAALVMPAFTLAIGPTAVISQVFGNSLRETLRQPYAATTSPAKGAGRLRVVVLHGMRNAAIPALTVTGAVIGNLLAGSVIVETVFSRSGVGRVMLEAVQTVDLTVVQGIVLLSALVFVVVNALVDAAYALIDPRLRVSRP